MGTPGSLESAGLDTKYYRSGIGLLKEFAGGFSSQEDRSQTSGGRCHDNNRGDRCGSRRRSGHYAHYSRVIVGFGLNPEEI